MAPIPELTLGPGMVIAFEALDPTTSLAVAGVTVSRISISGEAGGDAVAAVPLRNLMRPTPRRPSSSSRPAGGAPARATTAPPGRHPPR